MKAQEHMIQECMERHARRYRDARWDRLVEPHCSRLREWFGTRMEYLQEEYRTAINEADNIIGKQWLYDRRPKLPERKLPSR